MHTVIEINDYIDNTKSALSGRIGVHNTDDIELNIEGTVLYPTVADVKQLVKFLNRVIKEAS